MNAAARKDDLATGAAITWCTGCGNFAILEAFKTAVRALGERGVPRERLVMVAGIGQHAKVFDYAAVSGFYSLHGRAIATAQGIKLANPDLTVFAMGGDGGGVYRHGCRQGGSGWGEPGRSTGGSPQQHSPG